MPVDNRYLEKRRQGYYCVVEVPPSVRPKLNCKRLKRTLQTRDINVARAKRWAVVTELKAIIEAAKRGDQPSSLNEEAMSYRESNEAWDGDGGPDDLNPVEGLIEERAEQIAAKHGSEAAGQFSTIALGLATPLKLHLELWLKERSYIEKTKDDHRRAVEALLDHAGAGATVEGMTKRKAGTFVTTYLAGKGITNKTINKYLSSLSSYWRWMMRRGLAAENPWQGQSVEKEKRTREEDERPFTKDEMVKLFKSPPDLAMADLMAIGALSGMRLDEICALTVGRCASNVFDIVRSKTPAGIRKVPIHSDLVPIIERRRKDKATGEFLFPEFKAAGVDGRRSDAISKRFGRYRQDAKVHDLQEGRRRSLVNFHSFRRWFISMAETAGQPFPTIELVVGHKREGQSAGVYSQPDFDLRRICVEAVKLPFPLDTRADREFSPVKPGRKRAAQVAPDAGNG
ncbi:MAG TPA: DUF6538 domain-containing protein [Aliidongia sp.]|nr:DUF6538 domain-containing protein [Aliidongia sp.]